MGVSRQEYWSGFPFPSPGDLPDPEIEPRSPALQADTLTSKSPGKPTYMYIYTQKPITLWQIEGEKIEAVLDFLFLGSKLTADGD